VVKTYHYFLAAIEIRDRNRGASVRPRTRECNDWRTRMTVRDICRLPNVCVDLQENNEEGSREVGWGKR